MENKKSIFLAIPHAIIVGLIVGLLTYLGLNYLGYREYTAEAKIITSKLENVDDNANTAATYAATINSQKIKQKTLETLGIDWNVGKFESKLDIKPVENSSVINIVVTDKNKLRAEDLADQYAEYSVTVINNIYDSGAEVMEYSYGLAKINNNIINYALIAAGASAIVWAIIDMIAINSHNKKVSKTISKNNVVDEVHEVREVKKDDFDDVKEYYNTSDENEVIKDVAPITNEAYNNDAETTKVIDTKEINDKSNNSIKYEILGKLPSYDKGELDV